MIYSEDDFDYIETRLLNIIKNTAKGNNTGIANSVSNKYSNRLRWHVSQKQQRSGEDRYQAKIIGKYYYFAIFDGHGGSNDMNEHHVADYCVKNLHTRLHMNLMKSKYSSISDIIINTFLSFDAEMYERKLKYGTTCTIVLIDTENDLVYQINLGDSRSIIFTNNRIVSATTDHEPNNDNEKARINAAGGFVLQNRVCGLLAVSRAFGDYEFKSHSRQYDPERAMVCAIPEITVTNKPKDCRIILTSDAPFENNVHNNLTLAQIANRYISESADSISKKILNNVVPNTSDDTTILFVHV